MQIALAVSTLRNPVTRLLPSALMMGMFMAGCQTRQAEAPGSFSIAPHVVANAPMRNAPIVWPGGVRGYQAMTYAQWPGYRPLTLDLYVPTAAANARLPLVVFIHGGAWLGGDPRKAGAIEDFPALLASLSSRGYVVASISYRLSGEATFPAAAVDVHAALRWLRSRNDLPLDPARTILWGASAGGHLAALAATSCGDPLFAPPARSPSREDAGHCIQGVVAWYGIFNFATIAGQARTSEIPSMLLHDEPAAPEWRMLGCVGSDCGERLSQASPASRITRASPAMLLITGSHDRTVPAAQSVEMAQRLGDAGVAHELLILDNVDHSFIGASPAATEAATRQAVQATFRFIDAAAASFSL